MQKLDKGVDIFEGLDEYLKNPAAFGKPSDENLLNLQASVGTSESNTPSRFSPFKSSAVALPVDRTQWVKLSHLVSSPSSESLYLFLSCF
jgi:hypothetical protein